MQTRLSPEVARVRELCGRFGDPAVSSVFLDVDGSRRPAPAMFGEAFERLAADLRHRARGRDDPRLSRSVEGDVERMRKWLGRGVRRATTRGVALFACSAQDWFEVVELPVPVSDEAAIGTRPRVRQLVERLERTGPFLVALADRRHLRLLEVDAERVEEEPPLVAPEDRAVDTSVELGGWERRREEAARIHLRRAAGALDEALRRRPGWPVVLGGPDDALADLERLAHPSSVARVAGRVGVRVGAERNEIAAAARSVVDEANRRRLAAMLEDLRQRLAGDHGGVVGLEDTLTALGERRVATLLVRRGFAAPGGVCPECGHVDVDVRQCPLCGATNVEVEDVVEVAIEEAVTQDATVEFFDDALGELDGGIAAVERF